jgi:hypothetical protein
VGPTQSGFSRSSPRRLRVPRLVADALELELLEVGESAWLEWVMIRSSTAQQRDRKLDSLEKRPITVGAPAPLAERRE